MASALHVVARAQKGPLHRAIHEVRRLSREKRGRTIFAAISLLALILCIPVHYHAKCDCTVEPIKRRYVAAPFAGPLEKSLVEPGDIVEEGQLLARMDGREVRMELSGTRADLHRATKERAGHLATHESGKSEVARYDVDRLQMRTELLEHRQQNVDIRSPIAGVVVSGDLEDAEGMPLEVGQTLFEIAPLDEMVVEVGIAEDDFAYIRPGMPVTIRLDAFPLRRFKASIERSPSTCRVTRRRKCLYCRSPPGTSRHGASAWDAWNGEGRSRPISAGLELVSPTADRSGRLAGMVSCGWHSRSINA